MTELMERSERVLVKYPLFKTAVARVQACFDSYETTAEPDCCPIVGESGSGKTTIISYFASLHPRVDHKWGVEVPVLLAKVPARPTVKSFAETLLYQLGDPLWSRGNTVSKSIRLRELLKRCRVRLLALDEFQHFVDVRQANIPNDVADWLKEQVEEAKLAIVVLGLQRCLEVLRQNEQLRRRFGATLRVGAFRWEARDDRTTYRAFLRRARAASGVRHAIPVRCRHGFPDALRFLRPYRLYDEDHPGRCPNRPLSPPPADHAPNFVAIVYRTCVVGPSW